MFGFLLPIAGKLVGRLFRGSSGSVVDEIGGALDKWHSDSNESARVQATLKAHEAEIAGSVATAVYAARSRERAAQASSSRWFVADASVLVEWAVGLALIVYLLPQNVLIAWYWARAVISTGALSPYPPEADLIQLVIAVAGLGGLNLVKKALK